MIPLVNEQNHLINQSVAVWLMRNTAGLDRGLGVQGHESVTRFHLGGGGLNKPKKCHVFEQPKCQLKTKQKQ